MRTLIATRPTVIRNSSSMRSSATASRGRRSTLSVEGPLAVSASM